MQVVLSSGAMLSDRERSPGTIENAKARSTADDRSDSTLNNHIQQRLSTENFPRA